MSKLFKLKEWLTIQEAINHISASLSEPVTEADIYRLALDKHLTLSVNFVNGACAFLGEFVGLEDIKFELIKEGLDGEPLDKPFQYPSQGEEHICDHKFTRIDHDAVKHIRGVWDLTLIGSEAIDLEFYYQQLTSGLEVTLVGLEGVFVEQDGVLAQLLTDFEENEYQEGSKAYCEKIEQGLGFLNTEKDRIRKEYKAKRAEFLQERKNQAKPSLYFPSGGLDAHDYVFVLRTSEVNRFLADLGSKASEVKDDGYKQKIRTPETSLIDSLGIMAILLSEKSGRFNKSNRPNSSQILKAVQEAIVDYGIDNDDEKPLVTNLNRDIKLAYEQVSKKISLRQK